ncbi:MAG: hypothetical protein AB8H12_13220 [Lewinella sp.]
MKHRHSDLPLYEQFTIQGFWAVSGWALMFSVQLVPIAYELKSDRWLPEWGFIEIAGGVYGIIWTSSS